MSLELDTKNFERAAGELLKTSSRTVKDFTNGQMLALGIRALKGTKKTDAAKLEHELGQQATQVRLVKGRGKRKGQQYFRRSGRTVKADSLAERILKARHKATGKWGIKGKTIEQKAANLIAARKRSVAFVKSGWVPGVRAFAAVTKGARPQLDRKDVSGVQKGSGSPIRTASPDMTQPMEATLTSKSFNPEIRRKGRPYSIAEEGLRQAFRESTADMGAKLKERLQADANKFSAK